MRTFAVINPRSGNGRTGRQVKSIVAKLASVAAPLTTGLTKGPMDAAALCQRALLDGYEQIVAVGGDGTINEAVNGFFRNGMPINPEARLALLTHGTGGDFRRTFGIEDGLEPSLARIAAGQTRRIDAGRLTFVSADGKPGARYFANIASFGLSGQVVDMVNRARVSKLLGGRFAFRLGVLRAALGYRNQPVRLKIDATFDEVVTISTVAVCNGQYFGGGMKVAPGASPDDGFFDVVILGDAKGPEFRAAMQKIYTGEHIHHPSVKVIRGRSVIATPVQATGGAPVLLDVDGEGPGQLPAMFDILPRALSFVC
jgi:YegS/Rv2252/BmrU family lipid kinase